MLLLAAERTFVTPHTMKGMTTPRESTPGVAHDVLLNVSGIYGRDLAASLVNTKPDDPAAPGHWCLQALLVRHILRAY